MRYITTFVHGSVVWVSSFMSVELLLNYHTLKMLVNIHFSVLIESSLTDA